MINAECVRAFESAETLAMVLYAKKKKRAACCIMYIILCIMQSNVPRRLCEHVKSICSYLLFTF